MQGLYGLVALIVFGLIGFGTFLVATRDPKPKPSTEMTNTDVALYREAARILARLVNITDVNGLTSEDLVSSTTRKQIDGWLTDYKKELNRHA